MPRTAVIGRHPRIITGRTVLLCLISFFGVILAMNVVMVRVALSSFSGVETESAYKAGLSFKNDVAAAHAQNARHWSIDAAVERGETTRVTITARDAQARPLESLKPDVRLSHPTDKRRDVLLEFIELSPGRFQSLTPLPEGRWDLVIGLQRETETVFRSKSRISL